MLCCSVFDEDPKRWRMNAEFVTTLGLALEIATQLSPGMCVGSAALGWMPEHVPILTGHVVLVAA